MHSSIRVALFALATPSFAFASNLTFSAHSASCANEYCSSISVQQHADLNGDGLEDLVLIQGSDGAYGTFAIGLNLGNGGFGMPVRYTIPKYNGNSDAIAGLVTGDFNHSGAIGVAVFSVDSGNVYVYNNNGKGALTLAGTYAYSSSGGAASANSVVSADFNHDNNPDLAFTVGTQLHVWLGNGKGGSDPACLSQYKAVR